MLFPDDYMRLTDAERTRVGNKISELLYLRGRIRAGLENVDFISDRLESIVETFRQSLGLELVDLT